MGQWSKSLAGEFSGKLQAGFDRTQEVLAGFREAAGDIPFIVHRSNHADRLTKYVNKYAGALSSLRELDYTRLVGFHQLDIQQTTKPHKFAPGWMLLHGDEFGLSGQSGMTAFRAALKLGMSVCCGHTHRQGWISKTFVGRTIHGIECGNLMNSTKQNYAVHPDWQQGFAIFHVDGQKVYPQLVPIIGGTFVVDGRKYAA